MGMYYHLLGLNESLSTDVRQKNNNYRLNNSRDLIRQGLRTPGRFQFTSKCRSFGAKGARPLQSIP